MIILAIETSCDETAIAVLKVAGRKNPDFQILSNIVASQVKLHQKYGGVYPSLAKREHEKNLAPVLTKALRKAGLLKSQISNLKSPRSRTSSLRGRQNYISNLKTLEGILNRHQGLYKNLQKFLLKYKKPEIDVIAVTVGPGLEPCLWTGVNFAKALAFYWDLPIIPIDHLESHILVNFLNPNDQLSIINYRKLFPAICLVVSGGHTQLVLMRDFSKYKIIGETRDDAAGECYDKAARILGLPYPGGPAIAKAAQSEIRWTQSELPAGMHPKSETIRLPRPMMYSKNYDFSFSGLKTAVLYKVRGKKLEVRGKIKNQEFVQTMASEIQQAINDVLVKKTIKAAKDFRAKTIILAGGVAANDQLREMFRVYSLKSKVKFLVPPKIFCTDNALMIAVAAFFNQSQKIKNWQKIKADANLRIS